MLALTLVVSFSAPDSCNLESKPLIGIYALAIETIKIEILHIFTPS